MTVYRSPFDTLACAGYASAEAATKKMLISSMVRRGDNADFLAHTPTLHEPVPLVIVRGVPWEADVGYFAHPITVEIPRSLSPKYPSVTFVDVRSLSYWKGERWVVNNLPDYELQMLRAVLTHIFTTAQPQHLKDVSVLPAAAYSMLISQSLQRAFMLTPSEAVIINMVAAYFYYCLFEEAENFAEQRDKVVLKAAQASKTSAEDIYRVMEGIDHIEGLQDFAEALKTCTGSVRLNHFTFATLLQFVAGNWIGHGSREMLGAALEHPPSWIAMVYGAVQEATYQRTSMGKIVDVLSRGNAGEQFVKNVNMLTGFVQLRKDMAEYSRGMAL